MLYLLLTMFSNFSRVIIAKIGRCESGSNYLCRCCLCSHSFGLCLQKIILLIGRFILYWLWMSLLGIVAASIGLWSPPIVSIKDLLRVIVDSHCIIGQHCHVAVFLICVEVCISFVVLLRFSTTGHLANPLLFIGLWSLLVGRRYLEDSRYLVCFSISGSFWQLLCVYLCLYYYWRAFCCWSGHSCSLWRWWRMQAICQCKGGRVKNRFRLCP